MPVKAAISIHDAYRPMPFGAHSLQNQRASCFPWPKTRSIGMLPKAAQDRLWRSYERQSLDGGRLYEYQYNEDSGCPCKSFLLWLMQVLLLFLLGPCVIVKTGLNISRWSREPPEMALCADFGRADLTTLSLAVWIHVYVCSNLCVDVVSLCTCTFSHPGVNRMSSLEEPQYTACNVPPFTTGTRNKARPGTLHSARAWGGGGGGKFKG